MGFCREFRTIWSRGLKGVRLGSIHFCGNGSKQAGLLVGLAAVVAVHIEGVLVPEHSLQNLRHLGSCMWGAAAAGLPGLDTCRFRTERSPYLKCRFLHSGPPCPKRPKQARPPAICPKLGLWPIQNQVPHVRSDIWLGLSLTKFHLPRF